MKKKYRILGKQWEVKYGIALCVVYLIYQMEKIYLFPVTQLSQFSRYAVYVVPIPTYLLW